MGKLTEAGKLVKKIDDKKDQVEMGQAADNALRKQNDGDNAKTIAQEGKAVVEIVETGLNNARPAFGLGQDDFDMQSTKDAMDTLGDQGRSMREADRITDDTKSDNSSDNQPYLVFDPNYVEREIKPEEYENEYIPTDRKIDASDLPAIHKEIEQIDPNLSVYSKEYQDQVDKIYDKYDKNKGAVLD